MKTTIELPDDLYREVKATAALRHRKMKDLVIRGLELVLEENQDSSRPTPLEMLKQLRDNPPYTLQMVREWQKETYLTRNLRDFEVFSPFGLTLHAPPA